MKWLARYLRDNELAPHWYTVKNVLKGVVQARGHEANLEYQDIQEILRKLDGVPDCCTCSNDRVRLNEIIKTLEDEAVAACYVFSWLIDVLNNAQVSRCDLVDEIRRNIPPCPGPVY